MDISYLKELLREEMEKEKRDIRRETFRGEVVDISHGIATIECHDFPKFEEGDPIGYIKGDFVEPLGTVIIPGKELTVKLERDVDVGRMLKLCDAEILVGYELQLKILDELDKYETVKEIVFGKVASPDIKRTRIIKSKKLDQYQKEVVESIISLDDGEILLVVGPPGTGKTTVICEAVKELYRDHKILITSHTNRAVDNALEKLGKDYLDYAIRVGRPEKILPNIREFLLSYKARTQLGERLRKIEKEIMELKESIRFMYKEWKDFRVLANKLERQKSRLRTLYEERNEMLREISEKIVNRARIVGSTLIKSHLYPLDSLKFDLVLIDECSQVSISLALLGMVKAKKWVLIGDHNQLLPIFKSVKDNKTLKDLSSFCHLLNKYENRVKWLEIHYRSNADIISFSSKYIYDGRIKPHPRCYTKRLSVKLYGFLNGDKPVVFLNVPGKERYNINVKSWHNESEAYVIRNIVLALVNNGIRGEDIGIITPYRAQRTVIKEQIRKVGEIEVNTVDAFQGREKSVIIYSITATSKRGIEFAGDRNRFNVAVTRAIDKLIVLGNKDAMLENEILSKFIKYAHEKTGYYDVEIIRHGGNVSSRIMSKAGNNVIVYLFNGQNIYGKLVETTDDSIIVENNNKVWFIDRNSIKSCIGL